jgi:hypothetical protein
MPKSGKQFSISSSFHRTIVSLVGISGMLLLSFYYCTPQFAWSQPQDELAQDDNAYTRAQTEHIQVGDDLERASQFYSLLELVKPKTHGSLPYYQRWLQLTIR